MSNPFRNEDAIQQIARNHQALVNNQPTPNDVVQTVAEKEELAMQVLNQSISALETQIKTRTSVLSSTKLIQKCQNVRRGVLASFLWRALTPAQRIIINSKDRFDETIYLDSLKKIVSEKLSWELVDGNDRRTHYRGERVPVLGTQCLVITSLHFYHPNATSQNLTIKYTTATKDIDGRILDLSTDQHRARVASSLAFDAGVNYAGEVATLTAVPVTAARLPSFDD